ncbi:hypothetical protein C499_14865 [Halogeometricum borinquense DSM 11551]|uniref:Uncharacterized protein n=2 Tax=Halogeometricum borinquense (strain ATCC 700274 / DSM 11551 / JCM 10706 / KCTC 4070 / PR3) TaxID=469382 RepID=L9UJ57_HALBP|nr:hypothetical protein [Halogeometricum borinquense]ELY24691.1 hypothetical protein C499_14865 [Halogeometricum borinquense DSM 11551]
MAEPKHYVVMEGLGNGKSDYTIQATGQVEKVEGRLGGVSVSKGQGDQVNGSTVNGTVWGQADGYRLYGGIKKVDIENPDHVQVHTGAIAGSPDDDWTDECEVTVRAEKVEFISGQGVGEGALELTIEHDIHGGQSERTRVKLPTGSTQTLGASIDNFKVPQGGSENKLLTTKVTEREPPSDWFTGRPDEGSNTMDITLACGPRGEVSQNVPIDSDRGNPGEIKVYYTIDDLSG